MKKQFHIKAPGRDPIIIDLNGNEGVHIHVDSNPTAFGQNKSPDFRIDGLRWAETEHFHLGWGSGALTLNDSFTVTLVESDAPATPLEKEELYVPPEKTCHFCLKARSEVTYLFEAGAFAHICDECVGKCQRIIEGRKALRDHSHLIPLKSKSPQWTHKAKSPTTATLPSAEQADNNLVEQPPVEPTLDEERFHDDGSLALECHIHLKDIETTKDWVFGNSLFTISPKWGQVYRVDFNIAEPSAGPTLVNRVICWKGDNGTSGYVIAFGQEVPPLPSRP